jgi:Phosphotransferase enzyme family
MADSTFAPPNGRTMADPASLEWLACLQEACELLWPAPSVITLEAAPARPRRSAPMGVMAQPDDRQFMLIPGLNRPPILVPADRRGAAAAVRYHTWASSSAVRLAAKALAVSLAGGLGGAVLRSRIRVRTPPGADTIESYLGSVMSRDIRVSMQLGRPRANRKPVLQMLNGAGAPVGFVKVGINPLTRSLVHAEHNSLNQLGKAGLTEIDIPRVLHYGSWHGLSVLVLSTLPAWQARRRIGRARLTAAMAELARVNGLLQDPLAGSEYLRLLRSRLTAADPGPEREAVLAALDTVAARAGDATLTFGSWHGDWSPWNMASTGRQLLVWDWERFTSPAPLGFDMLHHRLQVDVRKIEPKVAARRCLDLAPGHLAPFGIPASEARLTAILYLIDLATRYIADRQDRAGARLGATGAWLIPVIADEVAQPGAARHGG